MGWSLVKICPLGLNLSGFVRFNHESGQRDCGEYGFLRDFD